MKKRLINLHVKGASVVHHNVWQPNLLFHLKWSCYQGSGHFNTQIYLLRFKTFCSSNIITWWYQEAPPLQCTALWKWGKTLLPVLPSIRSPPWEWWWVTQLLTQQCWVNIIRLTNWHHTTHLISLIEYVRNEYLNPNWDHITDFAHSISEWLFQPQSEITPLICDKLFAHLAPTSQGMIQPLPPSSSIELNTWQKIFSIQWQFEN